MPPLAKIDENRLREMYCFENSTQDEIAKDLGVAKRQTIARRIQKLGLKRAYQDKDWLIEMNHIQKKNVTQMAELANCNPHTISEYMKLYEVPLKYFSKYEYNQDYFEKIDDHEKAYWLGFIVADGGLEVSSRENWGNTYRLRIMLSDKDHTHLEKFNQTIKGEIPIKKGITTLNDKDFGNSTITINSKKMVSDLMNLNVLPNKSGKEVLPIIDNQYNPSLLLGNFDGDGCFSYWRQNGNLKQELSFLGSLELMNSINDILHQDLKISGSIQSEGSLYKLRFTKISDVSTIEKYMYQQNTSFLSRKQLKFKEWNELRTKQLSFF